MTACEGTGAPQIDRRRWVEIITTAHELGIPTTSTMMYGHVEEPAIGCATFFCCARSKTYRRILTEFVPLGFIHEKDAPLPPWWSKARSKTRRNICALHALARVLLHGQSRTASLLGEAGFRNFARVFAGGEQTISAARSWKRAFQKLPAQLSRIRFAEEISCQDSLDWTSPSERSHDLQNSAHI